MKKVLVFSLFLLLAVSAQAQETQVCAEAQHRDMNGNSVGELLVTAYPLHGWIGITNVGTPVNGVSVEVYSADGKIRLARVITDKQGAFSFPKLGEGLYQLKVRGKHISAEEPTVRVSRSSKSIACLVAEPS